MLLPKLEELQIRGRREEAHIRSVGGATICCLYLSGERSRPFPARVAPPPFAPLRGAPSRTDWLGASGRHADDPLWLPYGGLLKLATSAVRASVRGLPSLGPQIAHISVSLPSAQFFSSAARGRAPFGAERFFVRGARRK